ncbi:hypothetical protein ASC64_06520 [Nocardioides sp. Root122]|uniref:hypothetical protein n=1 Tax=Nocardioides TaxID=1839 RepID=UPI0007032C4C|nr:MULTISPECIES: hypothetical protein [Nocardioides]KQV69497.1 hypothetical protein ASC64_06520 [Nocardioides sp. Root122]MCK9824273.1 hypothetical protein [Nocardioides cavernae]
MRRILAVVVLALSALVGLPGTATAGGPTSVLVTQPGTGAGALYHSDAAYDALVRLLPPGDTSGEASPPGYAGEGYQLTWMVHDVMPWRFDRLQLDADGNVWVSTTSTANVAGEWQSLGPAKALRRLLQGVLDDDAEPTAVSVPAGNASAADVPATPAAAAPPADDSSWFSLSGWRWLVPGALLGLLVGAAAARRRGDEEPRRVLVSS